MTKYGSRFIQNFRTHVALSSHALVSGQVQCTCGLYMRHSQPKIGNYAGTIGLYQYILAFDISVSYSWLSLLNTYRDFKI